MGRELIGAYPAFTSALQKAERRLCSLGAEWSLSEELMRDEDDTRVNEPILSMTLSTSVQLALVDQLRAWNITPTAVSSHSSGEAAAAYAAGAIDFDTAVGISYYRGVLTEKYQRSQNLRGAMLAAGLGPKDASHYIDALQYGRAVVACVNSPTSVTLSGDTEAIIEVEEKLTADNVFARRLKVSAAYHSHHMQPQVEEYLSLLTKDFVLTPTAFGNVYYSSPVTGKMIWTAEQLGPGNFVSNMTRSVLFTQAFSNMCYGFPRSGEQEQQQLVTTVIEIGPHSALAAPIRQNLAQPHLKGLGITYASCLERNKNAVTTMQNLVCTLLMQGHPVDLTAVNFTAGDYKPSVLQDLPSYPWNHSKSYWSEPRINKDHRLRKHRPHDLLGSTILGGNDAAPVWRHSLTASQLPWVRDHVVQSDVVYPGAGFIAMAVEAYEQLQPSVAGEKQVYQLTDIALRTALVIPETSDDVEVQTRLQRRDDRLLDYEAWFEFFVDSVDSNGRWHHHCKGSISRRADTHDTSSLDIDRVLREAQQTVEVDQFYESMRSLGIEYGPLFSNISRLACGNGVAKGEICVADTAASMPSGFQSRHIIHPSTLDALFQAAYATLPNAGQDLDSAMIPTKIASLVIRPYLQTYAGSKIRVAALQHRLSSQSFEASIVALSTSDRSIPAVDIHGLRCQAIGSSLREVHADQRLGICTQVHWQRDFTTIGRSQWSTMLQLPPDDIELQNIADARRASLYLIHDALGKLTSEDVANLEWYHKIFYDWMKYQVELAESNVLAPKSSKWLSSSAGVKQILIEKAESASVTGEMFIRIGKNLLPILRKELAPLHLMLEDKLLYRYYAVSYTHLTLPTKRIV